MVKCTCGCEFFQCGTFQHGGGDMIGYSISRMDCCECGKRWLVERDGKDERRVPFPSVEAAKIVRKHYEAARQQPPQLKISANGTMVYTTQASGILIGPGSINYKP